MALVDRVTERFFNQFLVALTNEDGNATTIDATRLGLAADDVEADLETYAGLQYDETVAKIVAVAVDGVVIKLQQRKGQAGDISALETRWLNRLEALSWVTSRDRVLAQTTSELTPSIEVPSGQAVAPHFDSSRFDGIRPRDPR